VVLAISYYTELHKKNGTFTCTC